MFCRQCGQQQAIEDVRFCSGCGAKLSSKDGLSTKRIVAMILHLALTTLAILGWGPQAVSRYMEIRILILLVSLFAFLLLFSSDLKKVLSKVVRQKIDQSTEPTAASVSGSSAVKQVGPAQHQSPLPVRDSGRNTADMVKPPSITEHTTELLDKK